MTDPIEAVTDAGQRMTFDDAKRKIQALYGQLGAKQRELDRKNEYIERLELLLDAKQGGHDAHDLQVSAQGT